MMGESGIISNSQNSGGSGNFDGPPVPTTAGDIEIQAAIVGTYKAYTATAQSGEVGIVINMEKALRNAAGSATIDEYLVTAATDPLVAERKVKVYIPSFNVKMSFAFKNIVTSSNKLKNLMIIHPNGQIVFAALPEAPETGVVFQTADQDLIIVGGTRDGFALNQMVLVAVHGQWVRPNSSSDNWGRNGTLYIRDANPKPIPFNYSQTIINALVNDCSSDDGSQAILAKPAVFDSLYNPANFVIVQYKPGMARVQANINEVRFIVFPPTGDPVPLTWCNSMHNIPGTPNYNIYGCTPARLNLIQAAIDAQASGQGVPASTGPAPVIMPGGVVTVEPI